MTTSTRQQLPETGFLRIAQIVGNKKRGIPPIIPVCAASFRAGVRSGKYPSPVKLGPRTTVWRVEDIRKLISDGVENTHIDREGGDHAER